MAEIIVCLLAGLGAGLGTGFAGLSAATVISPMLIVLLGVEPYEAIAIALASDVLASAVSSYNYAKNKNLDIKNGFVMLCSVLLFTTIGSYAASKVSSAAMGGLSVFMPILLGLKFIFKPVINTKTLSNDKSQFAKAAQSFVCGIIIGFICGFIGAGGGLMMLLLLTSVFGYELKPAIGTSVFIMTFTAFAGASSHFIITGLPDLKILALCIIFTLVFAQIGSVIANKAKPVLLNRIIGFVLFTLGMVMVAVKHIGE